MINVPLFLIIFIIHLAIVFYIYYKEAETLIIFHQNSLIVDIAAWFGGAFITYMAFLFDNQGYVHPWFIWTQLIIGITLLNIHVARFVIREWTKKGEGLY
mgnify:CR=1 FL=1